MAVVAADTFTRTSVGTWGSAPTGGAYTEAGSGVSGVSGGLGTVAIDSANIDSQTKWLQAVSTTEVVAVGDFSTDVALTAATSGGNHQMFLLGRLLNIDNWYGCLVSATWNIDTGVTEVKVHICRMVQGGFVVQFVSPTLFPQEAGQVIRVEYQLTGISPTTQNVRVWRPAVEARPANPLYTRTNSATALQVPGSVGVRFGADVDAGPVTFRFDNWSVDGTTASSNLNLSGTIASSTTVTGTFAGTSALAGTIAADANVTGSLDVGGAAVFALDTFTRNVANGWGAAQTGGAWAMDLKVDVVDPPPPPPGCDITFATGEFPAPYNTIVGGDGGTVYDVFTPADLVAKVALTGPRIVRIKAGGEWNIRPITGHNWEIRNPFLTIDGRQAPAPFYIRGVNPKVMGSQMKFYGISFRPGDTGNSSNDANTNHALVINPSGPVSDFAFIQCEFMWAADVNFVIRPADPTNPIEKVFIDRCIFAEPLRLSPHPSGTPPVGHALNFNNVGNIDRVLVYRSITMTGQGRNFRTIQASRSEYINCALFNYDEPPKCSPRSMHLVNCLWKKGPAADFAGLGWTNNLVEFQPSAGSATGGDWPTAANEHYQSIYIANPLTSGFTATPGYTNDGEAQQMLRTTPHPDIGSGTIAPLPTDQVEATILSCAGVPLKDAVSLRLLEDFRTAQGHFVDGNGAYPPVEMS